MHRRLGGFAIVQLSQRRSSRNGDEGLKHPSRQPSDGGRRRIRRAWRRHLSAAGAARLARGILFPRRTGETASPGLGGLGELSRAPRGRCPPNGARQRPVPCVLDLRRRPQALRGQACPGHAWRAEGRWRRRGPCERACVPGPRGARPRHRRLSRVAAHARLAPASRRPQPVAAGAGWPVDAPCPVGWPGHRASRADRHAERPDALTPTSHGGDSEIAAASGSLAAGAATPLGAVAAMGIHAACGVALACPSKQARPPWEGMPRPV